MVPRGWVGPQWRKPSLHVSCLKKSSSPEPAGQFESNLIQIILVYIYIKGIQVCSNKLSDPLQGEIITKIRKGHLKFFLSRTTGPEKLRFK
jgi:hypothetical protein